MPWYQDIYKPRQWHRRRGRSEDSRQMVVTQDYPKRSRRKDSQKRNRILTFDEDQFVITNEHGDVSISLRQSYFLDP